ncbi:DUF3466 family protein [Vibrio sp.]|uniref:DUF3466 family protein n=1 Tax=Vibrio sp. TaxID=678 RepID=UPI003D10BE9E
MNSKTYKLSLVAISIMAASQANAALYDIYEIAVPGEITEFAEVRSAAIQQEDDAQSCFSRSCDNTTYKAAAETYNWSPGFGYREEVPYAMDNRFRYIVSRRDFEQYCIDQLRYSTCLTWSEVEWNGYSRERAGNYGNAFSFVENGDVYANYNAVINSIDSDGAAIGNQRVDATVRNEAFVGASPLVYPTNAAQTRAWKKNGNLVIGSVSFFEANDRNSESNKTFYSQPAIWDVTSPNDPVRLSFGSGGSTKSNELLGQGSLRDILDDGTNIYAVGYNTYSRQRMDATIFSVASADWDNPSSWQSKQVADATSGDNYRFSNSVVTAVNRNYKAIGNAKLAGDKPSNGAASNLLFYIDDIRNPRATYFSGGIFFEGAGGKAGAINNHNEIVGQVDAEQIREVRGKQRRKRGFIYPLDSNSNAIFQGKSWLLDDLTNDGSASSVNNQYRIIDATDINDAGVISATAIKCEGGYDTTAHNSFCGQGSKQESIVAIKLVPKSADTSIITRGVDQGSKVERKGGSLGWLGLGLLALIGFRRK